MTEQPPQCALVHDGKRCQHAAEITLRINKTERADLCEYHAGYLAGLAANRMYNLGETA